MPSWETRTSLSTVEQTALSVSSLAAQIGRAGSILQNGATEQIEAYKSKFEALEGLYDRLFKDLIVSGVDYASAFKTAKQFFGTSTVPFAGIDGTETEERRVGKESRCRWGPDRE